MRVFQEIDNILKINTSKQLKGTLRDIINTPDIKITKQVLQANLVKRHIDESQDSN